MSWPSTVDVGAIQANAHRPSNIALRCFDALGKLIEAGFFQAVMSAACTGRFLFIILLIRAGPTCVAIGQRRNYTAIRRSNSPPWHFRTEGALRYALMRTQQNLRIIAGDSYTIDTPSCS